MILADQLPARVNKQIEATVSFYKEHRIEFFNLARRVENDLIENQDLKVLIHSTKFREKDPDHLRDKLQRKALVALKKNKPFTITKENLFLEIDDLSGVRLLHIYRDQLVDIDPIIRKILGEVHDYKFREKPKAYTWDAENAAFYKGLGFQVETNPSFYTSVHYVVRPRFANLGCELQVRTLAEELWGEVSHTINYPSPTSSLACREQLSVLARAASACTRLVDSIYVTADEFRRLNRATPRKGS